MTCIGFVAFYFAVQISPLTKQETFFPDDTPVLHTRAILQFEFTETSNSQNTLNVVFHWGIKDLDRSEVKAWDARSAGSLIWDEEFTITPPENQQALLDLCQELRETDRLVKDESVTCWIEEMDRFVTKVSEGTIQLPIEDETLFLNMLQRFIKEDYKGREAIQSQQIGLTSPDKETNL